MKSPRHTTRSRRSIFKGYRPDARAVIFATFSVASLFAGQAARAVNYSYIGTGDGNWNVPANYTIVLAGTPGVTGSPIAGDNVLFNFAGNNHAENIYLNGNEAAASLTFANTGTTTLLGGVAGTPAVNTLTLTAGIVVNAGAGAVTIGDTSASAGTAGVTLTLGASQAFTNNSTNALIVANNLTNSAATTLTLNGTGNFTSNGGITQGTGLLNLSKIGQGTLTINGTVATAYTGTTTLAGGTVNLDYSQGLARLGTGILVLNGTNLNLSGGSFTQAATSTTLNAGATTIARTNGGNSTITLGVITGTAIGGALNFATAGVATTTSAGTNGILGARYTVGTTGAADWAVGGGTVSAYTSYTAGAPPSGTASALNYFLQGSGTLASTTATTFTGYTLKIAGSSPVATGESLALDPTSTLALSGNGLLFTGAQDYAITGGTLRGNANAELIVNQYGAGNLTVSSTLALGSGVLTKTGPGTLTLTGANTYTGATYVDAGTLAIGGTTITPFGTGGAIFLGDAGTLNLAGGAAQTIASLNNVYANAGGNVVLGANTLTLNGATAASFGGTISGTGGLIKTGASTQTFLGLSTYTGVTTLNAGVLNVGNLANGGQASGLGMSSNAAANLVFSGGALQYNAAAPATTDRLFTLSTAGGTIDSSAATSTNTLTFSNTGPIALVGSGARTLTLTGANTGNNTFAPQITDGTGGATTLAKTGVGTWVLGNAANSYTGGTTITLGTLNATAPGQLGTGMVTVTGGVAATVLLSGAGTYNNAVSIGSSLINGNGVGTSSLQLANGATLAGPVTLTSAAGTTARITASASTGVITGQISGAAGVDFGAYSNNVTSTITLSNPLNNYAGDTILTTYATTGAVAETINLGASNVIPNGTGTGNVSLNNIYSTGSSVLQLNGFNETINGLNTAGGGAETQTYVQNTSTTTNSTFTLGDNNANGNYLGLIRNNAANAITGVPTLALVKIGTGTQTLAGVISGTTPTGSTYTGGTTVNSGTLRLDFSQTTGQTTTTAVNPTNYLAATGALALNGGTFQVTGRGVGTAQVITASTFTSRNNGIVVTAAQAATIQPGQTLTTSFTNNATTFYVTYVDRVNNIVYFNSNAAIPTTSGTSNTYTFAAYTGATSSQTLAGVTLGGGSSGVAVNANGSGGTVFNMGGITRNGLGTTLDFALPAGTQSATNGVTTSTATNTGGVLSTTTGTAYATVAGTNWAANTQAAGALFSITAVAGTDNTYTAGTNTNVVTSGTQTGVTVNTLRFATGGANLDLSGTNTVSAGGILVTSATAANAASITSTDGTGGLAPGAGQELVIVNNGALNVGAQVVDGASGATSLSISGFGTTTFTGTNSYQGTTTLNGGVYTPGVAYTATTRPVQTVYVNGGTYDPQIPAVSASGLGNGSVVVNVNAVLAGTGVVNALPTGGSITVNGGGTVSPGGAPGTVGVLSLVATTTSFAGNALNGRATLTLDVTATTSDLLQIAGDLDLSGSLDQLVVTGTTGLGSYKLVSFTGTRTGTFDAVTVPTGYQVAYVDPANGLPGEVDLVAVPEPGTWAALALGGGSAALGGVLRRRRRRQRPALV